MATLNMKGAFLYDSEEMKNQVDDEKIANYALGYKNDKGTFIVQYVGRSDTDLRRRLIKHITDGEKFEYFKFSYAKNVESAFKEECRNYHDFGENEKLINEIHPDRPENRDDLTCPYCNIFD